MVEFRAEKTTQNKDDNRVLLAGSVIAIFLMMFVPKIAIIYDNFWATRPFITATVEVKMVEGEDRPMILYDADATQYADATWIASIRGADEKQMFTIRGQGSYSPELDKPRLWKWSAWFDNESGNAPPVVPEVPFKVCVRYVSIARDSGVSDESPVTCSELFFPNQNDTTIVYKDDYL
jgi:hypothetical protein